MKKVFTLTLVLFLGMNLAFAQEQSQKPTVIKSNYFDVSPPLRDMVQKSDSVLDNSWKEGIVKNKLNTISHETEMPNFPTADPVRQMTFGDSPADTTIQNFDGVGVNGALPPDTDGDVSPSYYMQVVNSKWAIYDKNGTKLVGPSNNSVIFTGLPHNGNDGDGILLYDENADRWLFSQFALPNYPNGPFYENVAISTTNDPTGSWYRYEFTFADMPDYPKLAVWVDGYYMTIRLFTSGAGQWISPAVVAMDRSKMLVGDQSASMVMFSMPSSAEGTQAADCDSEFPPLGTPCPVGLLVSTASASVRLYDFHVDWTTPTNSTFVQNYTIPFSPMSYLNGNVIPQKGTTKKLDAMSGKRIMFRMPYRKFNGYSTLMINTTVNAGSGVAGIRWLELRNNGTTWSLYQEGTYAPNDGNSRWMGSIAMDAYGNIALGYSISSANLYPSIRYTGRLPGDPPGVMTIAEKGIINGGGCQTDASGRWGDYSAMSPDPSVPGKFWYTQEYFSTTSSSSWKTRIGSFGIFTTVAKANPTLVCQNDSVQLSITAYHGSGNYTYNWSSVPAGFTSTLSNPKALVSDTTLFVCATSDGISTRHDTIRVDAMHPPVVSAGADTVVCWYVTSVPLNGSASNYTDFHWTTDGSGTFSSPTSFYTTYLPTLAEKILGHVDVKLNAIPNLPCTEAVISTKRITFDDCVGIDVKNNNKLGLLIQPNPAHGTITIGIRGITSGTALLSISSVDGKTISQENLECNTSPVVRKMDISGFAKGIYFVKLQAGTKTITEKMIVQ